MIAILCSSCQKKLAVKDDLAGKKVKCPVCGHVTVAPMQTVSVSAGNDDLRTVSQEPKTDLPMIAPAQADASNTPTNPSLSKPDATQGVKPDAGHDVGLTDFLAPPQADDELGRLGDFRILKILGHGGMGVVFLGEDATLRRKVAIKAMLPHLAQSKSSQQRFLREARSAATLEHDHIVAIHHVGVDRGAPYIVMPFLKGEPLDERLKRCEPGASTPGALPLAETLRIGREIAEALAAAHAVGLVHRDIKPANVWLEARGEGREARDEKNPSLTSHPTTLGPRVKILDFGLARAVAEDSELTQQGAIVGTPAYMSPEQGRGEHVDARCDLWSLGVVLYRMCTGELPFKGANALSTLRGVEMTNPPPPVEVNAEVPAELSVLVMKLLEKNPADRTSRAAEVVQALQAIETKLALEKMATGITETIGEPSPVRGRLTPSSTGASRGSARRPVALIAVALLALFGVLALGAGAIYYWQTNNGIVRIDITDPDIKVAFDKNGPIITGVDQKEIKLTPGEFGLTVERGDLKFDTDKFILKRGETITLKIEWFKDGKLQVVQGEKVIGTAAIGKEKPVQEKKVAEKHSPFVPLTLGEKEAKKLQEDTAAKLKLPVEATDKIGMKLRLIPPLGKLLPQPYYLGKYEVTQGEWENVMGYNPSKFGPKNPQVAGLDTSKFPVEQVNWYESVEFCNKLSEREGLKPYYDLTVTKRSKGDKQIDEAEVKILGGNGYHLPTEAEWEHGCRAGTKTLYHFGDKEEDLPEYAWFDKNSEGRTHAVGEKKPNAFGLYDTHGNVGEWTENLLNVGSTKRLLRGGTSFNNTLHARSAGRDSVAPAFRGYYFGFRAARIADGSASAAIPPLTPGETAPKKLQEETAAKLKLPVEATNKIGMKLRLIPPGVGVAKPFYLGKFEVTQGEWEQVMKYNPSRFGPNNVEVVGAGLDATKLPVELVSWYDSVEFCNKLSEREGMKPYYELTVTKRGGKDGKQIEEAEAKILGGSGYHIPTDAEWEHGCRAGTKTKYHFGDKDEDLLEYAWFKDNSDDRTHAVGEKKPNAFGLYDMHGNVWEWNEEMLTNAKTGASERVYRGGAWSNPAGFCAVSNRYRTPVNRSIIFGLRLARAADGSASAAIPPRDDAWLKLVAALPAEQQVKAVADKLHDRNLAFDAKTVSAKIDQAGVVTDLEFVTDNVTDISPVRALTGLQRLKCGGTHPLLKAKGKLEDLTPLKDMKLTALHFPYTKVSDLTPLKGMPLTELNCHHTKVADLAPLKNTKLTILDCGGLGTPVADLSPLRGLPLVDLRCNFNSERDSAILRSIKTLKTINGKSAADFWKEVDKK